MTVVVGKLSTSKDICLKIQQTMYVMVFCRPIKYMFKKETAQTTLEELKIIEDQIKIIVPTTIKIDENNLNVKHTLVFIMIDGKVIK